MSSGPAAPFLAEPPAIYLVRPALVVDCSVVSAVLFDEAARDEATLLLGGKTLHAPDLLSQEIVSVALKKTKLGWTQESVALALQDFSQHDVQLHASDPLALFQLAQRYKLSAYDAAYLLLAESLKAPLATFDAKLAAAAKTHLASLA